MKDPGGHVWIKVDQQGVYETYKCERCKHPIMIKRGDDPADLDHFSSALLPDCDEVIAIVVMES